MNRENLLRSELYVVDENAENEQEKENNYASKTTTKQLATCGLIISLAIIAAKVFFANRDSIYDTFHERVLIRHEFTTENGQLMFKNSWQYVWKRSSIWFPLLCGLVMTYFTWIFVYLDSDVPGVDPPSPFSPSKIKKRSGHTFHMNYMFAVVVGILTTTFMYYNEVSLKY